MTETEPDPIFDAPLDEAAEAAADAAAEAEIDAGKGIPHARVTGMARVPGASRTSCPALSHQRSARRSSGP